jgi:hypothetical protein
MACLVCVYCVPQIDVSDEDVVCNKVCSWCKVVDRHCYVEGICVVGGTGGIDINRTSGLDALTLSLHVTHLSFLQFMKILGGVFLLMRGQVL